MLLSDAVVDNGLSLMAMPPDLDAAFRKFIPPFGASGNPVDITGGEPPKTYHRSARVQVGARCRIALKSVAARLHMTPTSTPPRVTPKPYDCPITASCSGGRR